MREIDILSRQFEREKLARQEAESIAEIKSRELYNSNEALKKISQRLSLQHEIIRILVESASIDTAAPKILAIIGEIMQAELGSLWMVDQATEVLRCVNVWSVEEKEIKHFAEFRKTITFGFGSGFPGRVWESNEPCWIEDICQDPHFLCAKAAKKTGLHTEFSFPISYEGNVLGVFEFFMLKKNAYKEDITNFLKDISHQVGIFIEREQAKKRVIHLSRLSGMAEVASSVLHNMGNTLNSVNTSIQMIKERNKQSKISHLESLSELIQAHKDNLGEFFTQDSRGQQLPEFLKLINEACQKENTSLLDEINALQESVVHIKKIIETLQVLTHPIEFTENVIVQNLLAEAIAMHKHAMIQGNIKVINAFKPIKETVLDRNKLMQILFHIIKNAIDSLLASKQQKKKLKISLYEQDSSHFVIKIQDNGQGILPADLLKIFSAGYTTKEVGHGFGLHSSALFAQQLDGQLSADSKGLNQGATFTLILPYKEAATI